MIDDLGKVLIPQAPRVSNDLGEYVRNVEQYARVVEQTFRQFERWAKNVRSAALTRSDIEGLDLSSGGTDEVQVIQGPPGTPGAVGAAGQNGANGATWRDGAGVPSNSLGLDGDYYLNTTTGDVYKKASGSYSVVGNLRGPTGATGPSGSSGPMIGARLVAATGTQSVPPNADTQVIFNGIDYDTNSMTGVANQFTIQTAGYYLFTTHIDLAASGTGYRKLQIESSTGYVVGTLILPGISGVASQRMTCSGVVFGSVGQIFIVRVFQNAGPSTFLGIGSGTVGITAFTASRLGA